MQSVTPHAQFLLLPVAVLVQVLLKTPATCSSFANFALYSAGTYFVNVLQMVTEVEHLLYCENLHFSHFLWPATCGWRAFVALVTPLQTLAKWLSNRFNHLPD